MHIIAVGLNHKTAPLDLREAVAIAPTELPAALRCLLAVSGVAEGCLLSTCNRTEVYVVLTDLDSPRQTLAAYLAELKQLSPALLEPHLYYYEGAAGAQHLFRVAAGLDAMVLGETQILGQVREAYQAAMAAGAAGQVLHRLLSSALAAGKRAQAETGIGQSAVSVSYAVVELVRKLFEGLGQRTVLAIGAGETAKLTVHHLRAAGAGQILVANRTLARAERLAEQVGGRPVDLAILPRVLAGVDVVISSTGAPGHVLSREMVQEALRQRRGRPIFLFDIAVPRDVEPRVGQLEGAFLYDLDDLNRVVAANQSERAREARRAERILEEELGRFQRWLSSQAVVPTIRLLRDKVETIRNQELERALTRLPDLSDRQRDVISAMTVALVNKILNDPTQRLKGLAATGEAGAAAATVSLLFGLGASAPLAGGEEGAPGPAPAGETAEPMVDRTTTP